MAFLQYKSTLVVLVLLAIFVFERIFPRANNRAFNQDTLKPEQFNRVYKNFFFWPINILGSVLVILPITFVACTFNLWQRSDAFNMMAIPFDILILDLFIYIWHIMLHKIDFLWRFHIVHHLDETLDSTSSLRFHFGEIFLSVFVRAAVIITFSIPFSSVLIFEALVIICSIFHHSNLRMPESFEKKLSKIIVTPSIHWVHHHNNADDLNRNFATIFSWWDKIFGTRSLHKRTSDLKIGVEQYQDAPFKILLILPFLNKEKRLQEMKQNNKI